MSNRIVAASAVLVALAAPAFAADRKVPSPTYPTIGAAVAASLPGDRIMVGPGVYQENVVSNVANLQFIGKNAVWDGTLTNGTAGVCLTETGGKTVVQGFTFRAGQNVVAQVQLVGDECRVVKCTSRGPDARFLKITGNKCVLDSCALFAVNSTAIEIAGDDALVQKLKTRQCDDDVVFITGDRATVTKCTFVLNEDSYSIDINGNDAVVSNNTFTDCDEVVSVKGDRAVVEKNKSNHTGDFEVTGDGITIRGNTINGAGDDDYGIHAASRTSAGGGVIEDNKITDTTQAALYLACNNMTVRRNRVTGAGTEGGEDACTVTGNGNTFTDDKIIGGGTHGFDVTGSNNTFTNCTAMDDAADGFHVSGAGNSLTGCKASLNTGEGLDNEGAGTTVTGCTFKDNRIDVANGGSFSNDATFATDNKFKTGGKTQAQQVD